MLSKRELLYFWGAVEAVTDSLKDPMTNQWGANHAKAFTPITVGCDEVVIYDTGHSTVVAINGSDKDKEEWKGNFSGYPIKEGMHKNFRKVGRDILGRFLSSGTYHDKIYIVGHSRGGALAQVMAHYLAKSYGIDALCITFGSPRPFTVLAKPYFLHHRVHTNGDIVPHIPSAWIPPFWKNYQTSETRIKPHRILGLRKKHGEYGEMIEKYVTK